jgi:molybdopterin-binding protein
VDSCGEAEYGQDSWRASSGAAKCAKSDDEGEPRDDSEEIIEVKISGLLAKVVLEIEDQKITSIITSDAAREMQLRKGQTAAALIKATEVMIIRL